MSRSDNIENARLANYLRAHVTEDSTVAVVSAGTLPYFLDRYAIDALGKSERHIARLKVPIFVPGHSKWDWQYIIEERRPDFVASACSPFCGGDVDDHTEFRNLYDVARAEGLTFWIRRESRAKLRDATAEVSPVL